MLLTFLIFAGCVLLVLIYLLWLLWPDTRTVTTVPGLTAVNLSLGNLSNIRDAGSLPKFLSELHEEYGPITSFWLGQYLCVSLGQINYMKMVEKRSSTKTYETALPLLSELLLGDADSDPSTLLTKQTKALLTGFQPFVIRPLDRDLLNHLVQELITTWKSMGADDHLPATEYMNALSIKIYARLVLNGEDYFSDNKNVGALLSAYRQLSSKIEEMQGLSLTGADSDSLVESLNSKVDLFIQVIQESRSNSSDCLSLAVQAFGEICSLGSLLSWSLHYITVNDSLGEVFRKRDSSCARKALREVFRLTAHIPYRCRILQEEVNILGHTLESGTVVFSAHSAVFWNKELFPDPQIFQMERDITDIPSPLSSFKGLDGDSFVFATASEVLMRLMRNFNLRPAFAGDHPGLRFGLTSRPQSEVWINLVKLEALSSE